MRNVLEISRELTSIAKAGSTFCENDYDRDRYHRLHEIASELIQATGPLPDFRWPDEIGYLTPKVDVRCVVFRDGEVLLVKERSSGQWTLPGGWADVNISPAKNAEKECVEESGYVVTARRIVSVKDRDRAGYPPNPLSIYKIAVLAELVGGSPQASIETAEVGFFPVDQLPPLDRERTSPDDITHARAMAGDAAIATAFN